MARAGVAARPSWDALGRDRARRTERLRVLDPHETLALPSQGLRAHACCGSPRRNREVPHQPEGGSMTEVGTALQLTETGTLPGTLGALEEAGKLTATQLILDDPSLSYEDFTQLANDLGD